MGLTRISAAGRPARRPLSFAALGVGLLLLLVPSTALAAGPRRVGRRPIVPAGAKPVGVLARSTQLSVTVTLEPRDPAALAAYASAVATPGSSDYHHYLSVAGFAQRFGPTPAEIAAARASLRAQGLTPGPQSANGLSFSVTAPADRLASAFHTGFERYHLKSGRTAYANTSAPQVSGSGASVIQGVIGLDNLAVETPQGLRRPNGKANLSGFSLPSSTSSSSSSSPSAVTPCAGAQADSAASSYAGYASYTADQIAGSYGFDGLYSSGDQGSGVTVALYELEPYSPSDINAYQSCYGTSASVTTETVDGGAGAGAGSGEAALDIEDVIGLAPKANMLVYEGPNSNAGAYDTYAQIVADDTANVISSSWGICEAGIGPSGAAAENTLFQEAATQGQSVLAAAGDSGADDCGTGTPSVDDPASQPYVTGVGGTSLSVSPFSETVWNDGSGGGAGGGGVSTLWSMPSYQSGFALGSSNCGSGNCREVPDVSADADENTGYDVLYAGAWTVIGGTSAATPTWASLIALADAATGCTTSPIGFANPGLYTVARSGYADNFNDVTSGNNNYTAVPGPTVTGYAAGVGYDMASGLGSPKGTALALALGAMQAGSLTICSSPSNQSSTAGRAVSPVKVSASSSATPITYSASGLPAGLSIGSSSGQISGTPTRPGTYTVSVSATDRNGMTATRHFTWIVARPIVSLSAIARQTGRVGSRKRIKMYGTDSVGARLTYVATGLPPGLTINPTTGAISGKLRKAGKRTVVIGASDAYGGSKTRRFRFDVRRRRA